MMRSFSHTELSRVVYKSRSRIVDRVKWGGIFGIGGGKWYRRVERDRDIPKYIGANRGRFGYLVDRDREGAGFKD